MIPANQTANLSALRRSLDESNRHSRAEKLLSALAWDKPDAHVEWVDNDREIGRFTFGNFPTSASIILASNPESLAWHSGFRWCLAPQKGSLEWFDLRTSEHWRRKADALTVQSVSGLTSQRFAETGLWRPNEDECFFEDLTIDFSVAPSERVANCIKSWWKDSRRRHLPERGSTGDQEEQHRREFTRFVAATLLLRTVEDVGEVPWLHQGCLASAERAAQIDSLFRTAADRLNSRVLCNAAQGLKASVKRHIILESYKLDVDFAKLDVDPVGRFYEDILGVSYEHTLDRQRVLFGRDFQTTEDRTARREQGVYYTPRIFADTLARRLVRPAVRVANHQSELPIITDIAAGSGELLCAALREVLSVPLWRKPDVVRYVLDRLLFAVDINPLAAQLCALNLLRTAIRYCPGFLDSGTRLPDLTQNLREGNGLHKSTIDNLPLSDIMLINPPFAAPNNWEMPSADVSIPDLYEVNSRPNRAFAFLAAALRVAKPGGSIGALLPSRPFRGPMAHKWRKWVVSRMALDTIIANYGSSNGVHSYMGALMGRKLSRNLVWRPKTRVIQISENAELDTGALLCEAYSSPKSVIVEIDENAESWLPSRSVTIHSLATGRAPLTEVLGDQFHQGVSLAPEPWQSKLFLFRRTPEGDLVHEYTNTNLGPGESTCLMPFVNIKTVSRSLDTPLWCEPIVPGLYVFVPPGGGREWFSVRKLYAVDRFAWRMARLICSAIKHEDRNKLESRMAHAFYEQATSAEPKIRFNATKLYEPSSLPLVVASKASPTAKSRRGDEPPLRTWVALDRDVVPISGLQMRAPNARFAAALVAWLSLHSLAAGLVEEGAELRHGSTQPYLTTTLAQWLIPDIRSDRFQPRLEELLSAFLMYRSEASGYSGRAAMQLPSYKSVQRIALSLWSEG